MKQKDTKEGLTARRIKFAKFKYEDELTDEQIAQQCGISRSTVYRWNKEALVQEEIERLAEADKGRARIILQRASVKAAQALLELVEKDGWGKIFNQETCRKAACDILQAVGLKVEKVEGEHFGGSLIIIRSGNGDGSTESQEAKAVPGRVRFQPLRIPRDGSRLGNG